MQNIAFIIYRRWAFDIFKNIRKNMDVKILITTKECEFKKDLRSLKKIKIYQINGSDNDKILEILEKNKIDLSLFYGWSWIVGKKVLDKALCFCLHPSLLPKYRGGTPIQHQLISGETESGVTVFKMTQGIDDGDIYKQEKMSLAGNIEDILKRVTELGSLITKDLIVDFRNNELKLKKQKSLDKFPPLKRRTPETSEIKLEDLENTDFIDLFNFVRGLRDPFPNAFIKIKDYILNILTVQKHKELPEDGLLLSGGTSKSQLQKKPIFLKLKDGFAKVEEFKIL